MHVDTPINAGSRRLGVLSKLLLWSVLGAALVVGVYAIRNPNGIEFGAPWPIGSEMVAVVAAGILGFGTRTQERRSDRALAAVGCGAAVVALLMLGFVAVALSFNQL